MFYTNEVNSETLLLKDVVLRVRGGAPFIVPQGRYEAWRQLHAGKVVVLNFHTKGEHQKMTCGAGRPPLGWPAWGCRGFSTAPSWMLLILS